MPRLDYARKKRALADKIRREVPVARLVAAMGFIMQHRRKQAGIDPSEWFRAKPDQLDAFMKTCSIHQLEMLREIALGLEAERLPPEALPPEVKFRSGLGFESKKKH